MIRAPKNEQEKKRMDEMRKKLPKPPPKPKPQPGPTPRPNPDIPRPSPLPPRIPFPDDRGPVPPPRGPRGPADQPIPTPSSPTKRNPGKEIIVNFAGGEYGAVNDEAAEKIAKKYNLEITKRPEKNDPTPFYLFSVKGDIGSNLSGIRNESGVRYVEPNSRSFIPEVGPDPIIEWEDNAMRAALAGEPIPAKPAQLQMPPRTTPFPRDFPPYEGQGPIYLPTTPPLGTGGIKNPRTSSGAVIAGYNSDGSPILADEKIIFDPRGQAQQQVYNDLLAKGMAQQQATGGFIPTPVQPTPAAQPSTQPATPTIPVPQARQNQQAMQNYTNLLNQGLANYRAQTGQPTFGQPKQQTPRNISTAGFPTPKPFG